MLKDDYRLVQAVNYIDSIPKFTEKNTLDHTRKYLEMLNNPQDQMKIIHVAGTNGKGSVCAYIASVLQEAGKKTGLFTSPHLVKINERFRINGKLVSDEDFLNSFITIFDLVMKRGPQEGLNHPTYFEWLFLMGMCIFPNHKVEYLVLETGLGGRMDTTNVIKKPLVTIITSIGLDHMEYLGNTRMEIAGEKAGIIKAGVPVIYDGKYEDVTKVIEEKAKQMKAKTYPLKPDMYEITARSDKDIDFSFCSSYYGNMDFKICSIADYQVENACLAVMGLEACNIELKLARAAIYAGIANMKWQGRMEMIQPGIIVDGAHNEPGIEEFIKTVKQISCSHKISYLFTAVHEKDYNHMIKKICQETDFETVFVTELDNSRKTSAQEIGEIFAKYTKKPVVVEKDLEHAFHMACENKGEDDFLFCVGSLYLVGNIEKIIGGQK